MSLDKACQSPFKYCPRHIALYGMFIGMNFFPEEWSGEALASDMARLGVTEEDMRLWWCTPCRAITTTSDDQRPARCPVCDAVLSPTDFRWLPPESP